MVAMLTVIFCVVNLMIGTIFITSRFKPNKNQDQRPHFSGQDEVNSPRLVRSPSSFLERVRSFNFSSYRSEQPEPLHSVTQFADHTPQEKKQPLLVRASSSFLERVRSFDFSSYLSEQQEPNLHPVTQFADDPRQENEQKVEEMAGVDNDQTERSESETSGVEAPGAKMRKSASEKAVVVEKEQQDRDVVEKRRPETMRESKESWSGRTAALLGEDEAVDEKANDFINRFRQQLKLQRLHSILRNRERLMNRGVAEGTTCD